MESIDDVNKLNEEYEDHLFRLVMKNVSAKKGKSLFEENEMHSNDTDFFPSNDTFKKFKQLLNNQLSKANKGNKKLSFIKWIKRASAAMLGIIIVFSLAMVTVEAFRIQVFNFLINIESQYTSYKVTDKDNEQNSGGLVINWTNAYVPTYAPEGFEITDVSNADNRKKIIFTQKDNKNINIIYCEYSSINSIAIDTENASVIEKIDINGMDGTLSIKEKIVTVTWEMDGHLFTVQGQLSREEAIKIAKSVQYKK